ESEGKSQHLESERSALVAIQVENRRGVQQDRGQTDAQLNRGLHIRTEHAINNVSAQGEKSKDYTCRPYARVPPAELRRATHHSGRNEDAECHGDQEELADEKSDRRRRKGIENVMQRIGCPGQLPRAEVGLTALL